MELGQRIKNARLAAGLSQRQLCGDTVTRNMLSLIESGKARPSMETLAFFARQLGKPMSYFWEEEAVLSPNQQVMAEARRAFNVANWQGVLDVLSGYREPDELFQPERQLLEILAALELAGETLKNGKDVYARSLLEQLEIPADCYGVEALSRRKNLLLGELMPEKLAKICRELPSLDGELVLRARDALARGDIQRSEHLLEAVEDKTAPLWNLLRGETHLNRGQFTKAAVCFLRAEDAYPRQCWPKLEQCYRELSNYEKAYEYACKQKAPS